LEKGLEIANCIAPEHLELMVENPQLALESIDQAGSVFLGAYTPEALGDYIAGTNHTLPTSGTARFSSPLGVYDFIKRPSFLSYSKDALTAAASSVITFAAAEGLEAHKRSVEIRLDEGGPK
jgi:histidinol dehydrogenase